MKLIEVASGGEILLTADSAIVDRGRPVFIPEPQAPRGWTLRVCRAWRVNRLGKCIAPRFARRYVDAVTCLVRLLPADVSALLTNARYATFDGAIALGRWMPPDDEATEFTLSVAGRDFDLGPRETPMEESLAAASRNITLRTGDIVCAPMACRPHPPAVTPDTHVEIRNASGTLLRYNIK